MHDTHVVDLGVKFQYLVEDTVLEHDMSPQYESTTRREMMLTVTPPLGRVEPTARFPFDHPIPLGPRPGKPILQILPDSYGCGTIGLTNSALEVPTCHS